MSSFSFSIMICWRFISILKVKTPSNTISPATVPLVSSMTIKSPKFTPEDCRDTCVTSRVEGLIGSLKVSKSSSSDRSSVNDASCGGVTSAIYTAACNALPLVIGTTWLGCRTAISLTANAFILKYVSLIDLANSVALSRDKSSNDRLIMITGLLPLGVLESRDSCTNWEEFALGWIYIPSGLRVVGRTGSLKVNSSIPSFMSSEYMRRTGRSLSSIKFCTNRTSVSENCIIPFPFMSCMEFISTCIQQLLIPEHTRSFSLSAIMPSGDNVTTTRVPLSDREKLPTRVKTDSASRKKFCRTTPAKSILLTLTVSSNSSVIVPLFRSISIKSTSRGGVVSKV